MPRSLLLATALIPVISACGQAQRAGDIRTEVQLQGEFNVPEALQGATLVADTMRYLIWLPDGYGEDRHRLWPLIVFLHGSGDADYNAPWVQSFGLPAVLHSRRAARQFRFRRPQPTGRGRLCLVDG